MNKQEFISLTVEMRLLQKQYFKSRDKSTLKECVLIENQVREEALYFPENHDKNLVSMVLIMMEFQQMFFTHRTIDILRQSKAAEIAVDKAIAEMTSHRQTSLF